MYMLVCVILFVLQLNHAFVVHNTAVRLRKHYSMQMNDASSGSGAPKIRSKEWAEKRGLTPGYGGYWPGDPNAKKHHVTIKAGDKSFSLDIPEDRYIYFYFEEEGIELPIVNRPRMCRQGCCTICTMKVVEGKVESDSPLGLMREFREEGYALSCCSYPRSDLVCEVQSEDEVYVKQWGETFEGGGVKWGGFLPEDD